MYNIKTVITLAIAIICNSWMRLYTSMTCKNISKHNEIERGANMTRLELENAILDIVDNADDMPRGDLQGVVEALAREVIA
jgi:hypothetical protein